MKNQPEIPLEGDTIVDINIDDIPMDLGIEDANVIAIGSTGYTELLSRVLDMPEVDDQIIQSFRVGKKYKKDEDTGEVELVNRGKLKGLFLAYPDESNKVRIGFSLCHKNDRFDYKDGAKIDGLGQWYARNKADKYVDSDRFVVADTKEARNLPRKIVKVPQSMVKDLAKFIIRCRKFYKDKDLPEWSINFALEFVPKLGFEKGANDEIDSGNEEDAG